MEHARGLFLKVQARRLWAPVIAMALVVLASNVAVQYPFTTWGLEDYLTWGAFTYPVAFLVTDLANRNHGAAAARKVVYAGFAVAVVLSVWLNTDDGACCKLLGTLPIDPVINGEGAGIAVRKGETELADKFTKAIAAIRENGKYQEINAKYFEFDVYGE